MSLSKWLLNDVSVLLNHFLRHIVPYVHHALREKDPPQFCLKDFPFHLKLMPISL